MSDHLQLAAAFFGRCNWPHTAIDKPRAIEVSHGWSAVPFKSRAYLKGGGPIFVYDSLCLERVAANRRMAVAEYITRVNGRMLVGAFELDWEEGECRFRTSIDLQGQPLNDALLSAVVYPNHQAMIDWLPHLMSVIAGESEAEEAFIEARDQVG